VKTVRAARSEAAGGAFGGAALHRAIGLALAIVFAAVGLAFLVAPDGVLGWFDALSRPLGMRAAPQEGAAFFRILAVGYMYLVTVLAFLMYRRPESRFVVRLLIQAKAASAVLSIGFFVFGAPYLIYLANGVCDGAIAIGLLVLSGSMRRGDA
jgi:hypothetical protein